jgi:hypothetical protein
MNKMLEFKISYYLAKGWGAIPVNFSPAIINEKGKIEKKVRFLPTYQEYHKKRASFEDVNALWNGYNGVAVSTGKISGITVIDVDTKNLAEMKDLPATFTVETNKGFHFYFKYTNKVITGSELFKNASNEFNIDIRNDGGIVYADPSEYELPSGSIVKYKILKDIPLAEFPLEWLKNIYKKYKPEMIDGSGELSKRDWKERLTSTIDVGSRNVDFASIIGGLLKRFPMDEWNSVVWPIVQNDNKLQEKPLSVVELKTTYDSICKAETKIRHQGGDIKDISVEVIDEDMRVDIRLEQVVVSFKIKNIISTLSEATSITWIQKPTGLSHEIPFYLKIKSDTNKEQWVRILSKAFDRKDNKEVYPWTIIVAKVVSALEAHIRTRQQDFVADTIDAKECTWLLEPFVQEDQINTIFGMGSSGKTLLSMHFSKIIAQTLGHKILFIDYEDSSGGWKNKLVKMIGSDDFGPPDILKKFVYFDSEQIPIADQVEKIKEVIKRHEIRFVVVDSASLATGESTSDEKAAVRLVSALKLLRTTVLLIAHQRKNNGSETPIGSIQYENQSRNVWNISGTPDAEDNHIIHVACTHTKANNTFLRLTPAGFAVNFGEKEITVESEKAVIKVEKEGSETNFDRIKRHLMICSEPVTARNIAESLELSVDSVAKNLGKGKKNGIFINTDDHKWYIDPDIFDNEDDSFVKV